MPSKEWICVSLCVMLDVCSSPMHPCLRPINPHLFAPYAGACWKLLSTTCFALISIIVTWLYRQSATLGVPVPTPPQLAFCQVVLPFAVLLVFRSDKKTPLFKALLTAHPFWSISRSLCAALLFLTWFQTLRLMPLTTASALRLLGPLLTFLAALVWLKERTSPARLWGLLGLTLAALLLIFHEVARTTLASVPHPFALMDLPFLSGAVFLMSYVGAYLSGKKLLACVPPPQATFSLLGLNTLWLGGLALFNWNTIPLSLLPTLLIIGTLEGIAQYALARALKATSVHLLAALTLWRFGLHTLFAIVWLTERPSTPFLLGAFLMLLATPILLRSPKQ